MVKENVKKENTTYETLPLKPHTHTFFFQGNYTTIFSKSLFIIRCFFCCCYFQASSLINPTLTGVIQLLSYKFYSCYADEESFQIAWMKFLLFLVTQ